MNKEQKWYREPFRDVSVEKLHHTTETLKQAIALVEEMEEGNTALLSTPHFYLEKINNFLSKFEALRNDPQFGYVFNDDLAVDIDKLKQRIFVLEKRYHDIVDNFDARVADQNSKQDEMPYLSQKIEKILRSIIDKH